MSFFKRKVAYPALNKDGTIELDEGCFDEYLAKNQSVAVMFYRTNCGHSAKMEPVFTELSSELKGKASFCKVSTPTNMDLVHEYSVKGTPTFIMFRNGSVVSSVTGEIVKDALRAEVEKCA